MRYIMYGMYASGLFYHDYYLYNVYLVMKPADIYTDTHLLMRYSMSHVCLEVQNSQPQFRLTYVQEHWMASGFGIPVV